MSTTDPLLREDRLQPVSKAPPADLICVGDTFRGPPIGHGSPRLEMGRDGKVKKGLYYVRAIVDPWMDDEYGPQYKVVFRFYSRRKGWRYIIEDSAAIAFGMFEPVGKAKARIKEASK